MTDQPTATAPGGASTTPKPDSANGSDGAPAFDPERRATELAILDAEGEVVGVVSIGDLNAHLTTHHEVTIHYLEEYLHGRV